MTKLKRSWAVLILAGLLVVSGLIPQGIFAEEINSAVSVEINAPDQVQNDEEIEVSVDINQVTLLNAANYRISYDASFLQLVSVTDGSIGSCTFPVTGYMEVQTGVWNIVNFTGGSVGLSGSGTLSTLHFQGLDKTGVTEIVISSGVLSGIQQTDDHLNAAYIAAEWAGDSIELVSDTNSGAGDSGGKTTGDHNTSKVSSTSEKTPELIPTPLNTSENGVTVVKNAIDTTGKFSTLITALSVDGKAAVTIEAGTIGLDGNGAPLEEITVTPVTEYLDESAEYRFAGQIFEFGPDGATFDKPVTLTIEFDSSLLSDVPDLSNLSVAWFDVTNGCWIDLDTTIDLNNHIAAARVNHFTRFAILVKTTTPEIIQAVSSEPASLPGSTETRSLPNPAPVSSISTPDQLVEGSVAAASTPDSKPDSVSRVLIGVLIIICLTLAGLLIFQKYRPGRSR